MSFQNSKSTNRRQAIQLISGVFAPCLLPIHSANAAGDLINRLAAYMVNSRTRELPERALIDAKHRILDTVAAMVSGSALKSGIAATRFIRTQGGTQQASILVDGYKTTAVNAAMANAMLAHSDESDDFEPVTKAHPGSAVVPAALAMAEMEDRSGTEFIRAVALGYDLGCRFLLALGPDHVRQTHRGAEAYGANFGSMAAAASLARFDEQKMRYALSYSSQQVSGLWSWVDDHDHIEKSFDFSGMGVRNGITAVVMVQAGLTGVDDVLQGRHNVLQALSTQSRPEELVKDLGERYFISESGIKTFTVGYPNQSPLDALITLTRENNIQANQVESVEARLPEDSIGIVSNSPMPDVNCQYLLATALIEGKVSFAASHSQERMRDPKIRDVMQRIKVIGDARLNDPEAPRGGIVEINLKDGRTYSKHTRFPPGTKENPLSVERLNAKARDLMTPVLGEKRTEILIEKIHQLEKIRDIKGFIRSNLVTQKK